MKNVVSECTYKYNLYYLLQQTPRAEYAKKIEELAKAASSTPAGIRRIMYAKAGTAYEPRISTVQAIARFLNLEIEDILEHSHRCPECNHRNKRSVHECEQCGYEFGISN